MMVSSPIHRREAGNSVQEKNSTAVRRETEFAAVLQTVSQKGAVTREERIRNAVSNAAQRYNLPPALILGVIRQESGFNPVAESHCGAQGLMQLMPQTAREMGVTDPFDIEQNIDGGSRYLRQMLDQFGGDVRLALAAYNAGPARVEQYHGIPPLEETMNYVPAVLAHYESFGGSAGLDLDATRRQGVEAVAFAFASAKIAVTPFDIPLPEISKTSAQDEPPPPPPPSAVRV